ncbi:ATP-binding protein [Pseudopelagicola sp. nBUS_20]|uniref:ATP-binding protein n=1 Tax=Pseudopelagicola sp. nBUS_20 TaxID=3395317 RepID=UPI003EBAF9CE
MTISKGLTGIYRDHRFGLSLATIASLLLIMIFSVSLEVRSNLERLRISSSDNIQWTVSQIEVEMLEFLEAITIARNQDNKALARVRQEFDIFYGRVQTLSNSPVYDQVFQIEGVPTSRKTIQIFLNKAAPLIDASDKILRSNLTELHQQAMELRPEVRKLAVTALSSLAQQSDMRRQSVDSTLKRLAILTIMLFTALVGLVIIVWSTYRQTHRRGIALEQANQRMEIILKTSLDGVIVANRSGQLLDCNHVARQIFGIEVDKVCEFRIGDLFIEEHLASLEASQPDQDNIIGKGRIQITGKRVDQTQFPVEAAIQVTFVGRQKLFVAFIRDISKRVANEDELVKARDRALAGETAKADFLTVMSHEIRTPLNGLLGNLELLEDTRLTKEQTQFIQNMQISGRILSQHVDGVLDLGRFEAGKMVYPLEPVDIGNLIQDVIKGQSSLAESQGTTLEWRWVGITVAVIQSNKQALEQVLLNLLSNAVKFAPNGRVMIEIEYASGQKIDSDTLDMRVSDTGPGISEQELETVFQDYVTRDTSYGRITGGSGLGLGIARRIIDTLGGKIGAESVEGIGSVFWFSIPTRIAKLPIAEFPELTDERAPRQLDILLVEDNEINREVAASMLKREGHSVSCAKDGQSGIDAAAVRTFDVILMDISMPVIDGFEAARQIRSGNGASRNSEIIAISANVLPSQQQKFENAGVRTFLHKPLSKDALREALKQTTDDDDFKTKDSNDATTTLIDLDHINTARESLKPKILHELFSRFLEEVDGFEQNFSSDLITHGDLPKIAIASHKAAGSAAVFGATALRKTLNEIEAAATASNLNATVEILPDFTKRWHKTKLALKIILP